MAVIAFRATTPGGTTTASLTIQAGTLFGVSYPGLATIDPPVVRTYTAGQRDGCPVGRAQALSYKCTQTERDNLRGVNGPAAKANTIATMQAYFQAAKPGDVVNCYAIKDHERDNDNTAQPTADAAAFKAEWVVFQNEVMGPVNAARAHPYTIGPCYTAAIFTRGTGTAVMDAWWTPGAQVVFWDEYARARVGDIEAWLAANGNPRWGILEWGKDTASPVGTDQEDIDTIDQDTAAWASNPPEVACWYDQGWNDIETGHPLTVARLRTLAGH